MARGGGGGEDRESSCSGEETEDLNNVERDEQKGKVLEYEKQRLSRIAENKARLEALGLSKTASALMGSFPSGRKRKGKAKSGEEDDDYRPGEADDVEDDNDGDSEYEDDDDDDGDEDEEFLGHVRSGSGKRKVKNKGAAGFKKKVLSEMNLDSSSYFKEDADDDLKKAVALSLQDSVGGGLSVAPSKKKVNAKEAGRGKKKKPFVSRLQMAEDELILYFYQFDEEGKGFITMKNLEKMATVHDFTWTQEELQDMICCYDSNNDGKLSLDDFRKIVTRCRMLKESDGS